MIDVFLSYLLLFYTDYATGWKTKESWFAFWQGQEIFSSEMSRPREFQPASYSVGKAGTFLRGKEAGA